MPTAALPLAAFFATAAPETAQISAQNPAFAYAVWGVVIGGLVGAVMVADRVDSMLDRRRRKPSVDVDLVGLQSSIRTLTDAVKELKDAKEDHNGHKERIIELERRANSLESQLRSEIGTQRSYIAKTHKDITDRIDAIDTSFGNNIQAVERGMGRVEGALGQLGERVREAISAANAATTAAAAAAAKS